MPRHAVFIQAFLLAVTAVVVRAPAADDATFQQVDFTRDVRPILAQKCFVCHGPDAENREAGLRLDLREAATGRLESGSSALVPGDLPNSELIRRITSGDPDERMPPVEAGDRLSEAEIDRLRRWILAGGEYAQHWSFVKPVRPMLPAVDDVEHVDWPQNGIDNFILARLKQENLRPSPRANRYMLIRRVSLSLRGLPPSPEEVEAFVADPRPDAYERVVEQYLAEPAFGERWARVWLDLARYADSKGYGSDPLRTIWHYRDWVIDALNANMPYDRFTIEQLAGDLLPDATPMQKLATAFHRNTMTNTEGGTDDEEFRVAAVRDRVDTTMQVWMGLTMGCAKCHNHRYDPITQKEYYRFYAFFNQTADADRPDEAPTMEMPTKELLAQRDEIETKIAELNAQLMSANDKKAIEKQIAELEELMPEIPTVPVMQELTGDKRRSTYVMVKGNFLVKGEQVEPATPASFHPFADDVELNRLGVARWLVDAENPLTARVTVNRFWARLFGKGIVETEEDFGTQGELPSHPELLDWLATEFVRLDWDVKALLRLIVTSETYRQTAKVSPALLKRDPRNRLLARGPRFRLEAEMVRDQALALSGLLSRKMHGPSVFPPQPPDLWRAAFNGRDRNWATSQGEDRYRRGLYTFWRRTVPYPSMATFDAPSREICSVRRLQTNTPLQAFVTLNDPVYVEAAQALARRIFRHPASDAEDRSRFALGLCLGRPPEEDAVSELAALYESELAYYRENLAAAEQLATEPLGPLPGEMPAAELAAWTVVANVLLNLDGVLTGS